MKRPLSTVSGVVAVSVWAVTMAVWMRGWVRGDSAYFVSRWQTFWNLSSGGGTTRLTRAGPWPAPLVARWVVGTAEAFSMDSPEADPLFGPAVFVCPSHAGRWHGAVWSNGNQDVQTGQAPASPSGTVDAASGGAFVLIAMSTSPVAYVRLAVPTAWLPAASSVPAALWLTTAGRWRLRTRGRRRRGLCVRCGYDRRQSPDRCPECGATAVA